ncbi:hypothetical protein ACUHMQ_05480 [Chitinimonas sp. PSY-7]|uniref:hypothetical protein n=1 Tax=Chitinimonas sp. PSY-7 TaxID=3459088 RepID=UPI0040400FFB
MVLHYSLPCLTCITPQQHHTIKGKMMEELNKKEVEVVSGGAPFALIGGVIAALVYGSLAITVAVKQ